MILRVKQNELKSGKKDNTYAGSYVLRSRQNLRRLIPRAMRNVPGRCVVQGAHLSLRQDGLRGEQRVTATGRAGVHGKCSSGVERRDECVGE